MGRRDGVNNIICREPLIERALKIAPEDNNNNISGKRQQFNVRMYSCVNRIRHLPHLIVFSLMLAAIFFGETQGCPPSMRPGQVATYINDNNLIIIIISNSSSNSIITILIANAI